MTKYEELKQKALSPEATQNDINTLGEWLASYYGYSWNGVCFDVEGQSLFPVLKPIAINSSTGDIEQHETVGYTFSANPDDHLVPVKFYAVISEQRDGERDIFVWFYDSSSDAVSEAECDWNHMVSSERKIRTTRAVEFIYHGDPYVDVWEYQTKTFFEDGREYKMTNEYWYAILRDSEDTECGTGSFDLSEAVKMAVEKDYEIVSVIKGDYVDGEPTTDAISVDELRKGEDFCDVATYYYFETNGYNGVLVTDGYLYRINPISSKGIDETSGVDINDVDELKETYRGLAWKGMLYNFEDIVRDYKCDLDIFNADDYDKLVMLVEVA